LKRRGWCIEVSGDWGKSWGRGDSLGGEGWNDVNRKRRRRSGRRGAGPDTSFLGEKKSGKRSHKQELGLHWGSHCPAWGGQKEGKRGKGGSRKANRRFTSTRPQRVKSTGPSGCFENLKKDRAIWKPGGLEQHLLWWGEDKKMKDSGESGRRGT